MSPIDKLLQEKLAVVFEKCLKNLARLGYVTEAQLRNNVYIRWDRSCVLNLLGHGAATTQDDAGKAVVYLDPNQETYQIAWCILHESVHVAQVCRGDLEYLPVSGMKWRGKTHVPIRSGAPGYFDQPWEKEADETMPMLIQALRESDSDLTPLLDFLEEHWDSLQNTTQ